MREGDQREPGILRPPAAPSAIFNADINKVAFQSTGLMSSADQAPALGGIIDKIIFVIILNGCPSTWAGSLMHPHTRETTRCSGFTSDMAWARGIGDDEAAGRMTVSNQINTTLGRPSWPGWTLDG